MSNYCGCVSWSCPYTKINPDIRWTATKPPLLKATNVLHVLSLGEKRPRGMECRVTVDWMQGDGWWSDGGGGGGAGGGAPSRRQILWDMLHGLPRANLTVSTLVRVVLIYTLTLLNPVLVPTSMMMMMISSSWILVAKLDDCYYC